MKLYDLPYDVMWVICKEVNLVLDLLCLARSSKKLYPNVMACLFKSCKPYHLDCIWTWACFRGYHWLVESCIEHGVDVNYINERGYSALDEASMNGHEKLVKMLIDRGANVTATPDNYCSALRQASSCGCIDVMALLLEHGANVNAQAEHPGHEDALFEASYGGSVKAVEWLIARGANVNASRPRGTALHVASHLGEVEVVEALLAHSVDVDGLASSASTCSECTTPEVEATSSRIKFDHDKLRTHSPVACASFAGHIGVVKLLLARGAEIDARKGQYYDALKAAKSQKHHDMEEFLRAHGAVGIEIEHPQDND